MWGRRRRVTSVQHCASEQPAVGLKPGACALFVRPSGAAALPAAAACAPATPAAPAHAPTYTRLHCSFSTITHTLSYNTPNIIFRTNNIKKPLNLTYAYQDTTHGRFIQQTQQLLVWLPTEIIENFPNFYLLFTLTKPIAKYVHEKVTLPCPGPYNRDTPGISGWMVTLY